MARPGSTVIYIEVTDAEREGLRRLQQRLGVDTVGNMIREALFTLADEAGVECELARRRPGRHRVQPASPEEER